MARRSTYAAGLLLSLNLSGLSLAAGHAGEFEGLPSADEMRQRSALAKEAEKDAKTSAQLATLAERLATAKGDAIDWNRDHREGELSREARRYLVEQGYELTDVQSYYYADDCGCTVGWGCTHDDPKDRRNYTFVTISWGSEKA